MKQIDYLKAFAIISVIILHTVPVKILNLTLSPFHIWNAVPIFILLSSFTTYISCSKKELNLKQLYTSEYVKKKLKRIVHPIIYVFIISIIIGIIFNKEIYIGFKNLILYMPVTGPSNYYITILLQYVIISPLLFYLYKKFPKLSLASSLIVNVISELLLYYVKDNYLYSSCILRYVFLIFIGFYLFDIISQKKNITKKQKIIYIILITISTFYILSTYFYTIPFFNENWKRQLFLANFYPSMLVYLGFKNLTKFEKILDKISILGKMSYHIFLVQMVYFSVNPLYSIFNKLELNIIFKYLILIIMNCLICLVVAYVFYIFTNKIEKIIEKN